MRPYSQISSLLIAIENCEKTENYEWKDKHEEKLEFLLKTKLPSGSGFDSGVKLLDESTPERLVFQADFHHMDDNGYYEGWSLHKVIVTSSLVYGVNVRVTGKDRRAIKDYISEVFYNLNQE